MERYQRSRFSNVKLLNHSVVLADSREIGFARCTTGQLRPSQWLLRGVGSSRQLTIGDGGPGVAETDTVRVGISINPRVLLEERYDIIDELVDLSLVGARSPALILDASELMDQYLTRSNCDSRQLTSVTHMGLL